MNFFGVDNEQLTRNTLLRILLVDRALPGLASNSNIELTDVQAESKCNKIFEKEI